MSSLPIHAGVSLRLICATFLLVSGTSLLFAQAAVPVAAPAVSGPAPCEAMRPAIQEVQSAISSVDIDHWKLSRPMKNDVDGDADSIRQDISGALPGLLDQAKASPAELAPQWAVVRNVDALYDVLVRVTTVASLTGSHADANLLAQAESHLADARKNLTAQLVASASSQDKEVVTLHAKLAAIPLPAPVVPAAKTIVVNNSTKHVTHHRTKPAPKPATGTAPVSHPAAPTGSGTAQ